MNILPEVIATSAPAMAACLAPGGQVMVSGIIECREGFVREALASAGLTVRKRLTRSEWVALTGSLMVE
jgi:ribosomal protein L11 methylase PrmA